MWESRQRFPRAVERVENLGLVFQAFHGPAFPQLSEVNLLWLLSSASRPSAGSDTIRFRFPECAPDR
jgi:hypothetical protein